MFIKPKQTKVWLCEWRALHRNGGTSLVCEGIMALLKNHTTHFFLVCLDLLESLLPGMGRGGEEEGCSGREEWWQQ